MRLCASYHCKNDVLDEVRYPIALLNNIFTLQETKTHLTFIVEILSLSDCNLSKEQIKSLGMENTNWVFDCYKREDFITLKQLGLPAVMYHYPITTYPELWYILQFQPYGVLIGEPLAFDLINVRQVLDQFENYIQLRVMPHLGRPSNWHFVSDKDNGLRHFWIVPQMLHIYEPYVDTLELYDQDVAREKTLVELYDKGEYLFGLTSLLKNCESEIPCPMITEDLCTKRISCGQRCMKLPTNCHYCNRMEDVIKLTKPNHLQE